MTSAEKCTTLPLLIVVVQGLSLAIAVASGMYEEKGPLKVQVFQTSFSLMVPCTLNIVEPRDRQNQPPVRLLVAVPTQSGKYPVVLFQHGFFLANCFYTQLFEHIASYGYIVVAPQVITLNGDATHEIEEVAKVVNWLPGNLYAVMPTAVTPDLQKVVLAGHSRGAKVAFALALGLVSNTSLNFSGLVALDPVDGVREPSEPPIVKDCDHCLDLRFPALIEGTGYGSRKPILGPACAPVCCGHQAFYTSSSAAKLYHFVASDFGHLDFLDDSVPLMMHLVCESGQYPKARLRTFTGGLLVAFLQFALNGNSEPMDDILRNWQNASIKLQQPQYYTRPPTSISSEQCWLPDNVGCPTSCEL